MNGKERRDIFRMLREGEITSQHALELLKKKSGRVSIVRDETMYFEGTWQNKPLSGAAHDIAGNILVFDDSYELLDALTEETSCQGSIILVRQGNGYKRLNDIAFKIDPAAL